MRRSFFLFILLSLFSLKTKAQEDRAASIKAILDEADVPGMSLVSFKGENMKFYEFGYKNIKTLEPVDRNTVFQAASLTKVIIATICLQLYEERKINLSAPLWRTVAYPKLDNDKRARKITARMVLSHTSGLPNWGEDNIRLKHEAGTKWGYSGEAFVWLGMVLEKLTNKSLEELAQERIFDPLEMNDSALRWNEELAPQVTNSYNEIELEEPFNRFETVNAAASLWTTARDYAVFMQALLNGKILRWTSMTLMFNPRAIIEDTNNQLQWGYGIGLEFVDQRKALWHWGDNRLFRCFVYAYPDTKEGFVYFTNSENGLSILEKMMQLFYPGEHPLVSWLDYPDYRNPGLQERKDLKLAFLYQDSTEALQLFEKVRKKSSSQAEQMANSTYWLLMGQKKAEKALPLLRCQLKDQPTSADLWKKYADALAKTHQYLSARQAYKRVIAADPDQYYVIKNKFRWLEEGIVSKKKKKPVSNLNAYAGKYHNLIIRLKNGQLVAISENVEKPVRLIPINEVIFELDDQVTYRYKFELREDKSVEGLVIYDIDGMINYYPKE